MSVAELRPKLEAFYEAVQRVLVGQRPLIDRLVIALLCDGHVLLEGVPGLAKTLTVKTIAQCLRLQFARVQFTPDLLPADVVGTQIYHPRTGEFTIRTGPIFTNVLLADEINRAPAKVQSALLEAMQERQVTIGEESLRLPDPFFVLATQNPIEHEGTYPLPEAQIDRFIFKLVVQYPSKTEELLILDRVGSINTNLDIESVFDSERLHFMRQAVDDIYVDSRIKNYIVDLVRATRFPSEYNLPIEGLIQYGASPRATLSLYRASKGQAFLAGRNYVTPDDVKQIALDVMRHRVILHYEAEADDLTADLIVQQILDGVPVP